MAVGVIFFGLGVMTFFDAALLAFGNIMFLFGAVLIIGPQRSASFFIQPSKIRGSVCLAVGILLILFKRSFIGFSVELVGILQLFGDFFAVIIAFLRSMPIIGPVLSNPYIAPTVDRLAGVRILPV